MRFVNADGLDEAISKLQRIADRGEDMTELLREIGDDEVMRTVLRFENSKAPDGTPWKALQEREGQPLVDTGQLKGSITKQLLGSHAVVIGTDVAYAEYHQFGTRHIDPRPFIGVSDDLIRSVEELTNDYFIDL